MSPDTCRGAGGGVTVAEDHRAWRRDEGGRPGGAGGREAREKIRRRKDGTVEAETAPAQRGGHGEGGAGV